MGDGHIALRKGRHSIDGQVYLVTFATSKRARLFEDWAIAADAARILSAAPNWQGSRLMAWVLMPDHWHGLVLLGDGEVLSSRIGWIKAESSRALRRRHSTLGSVWARSYHDRALRMEDDVVDAARYVVLNPVRAGLVQRIGDYPFWDAVWV